MLTEDPVTQESVTEDLVTKDSMTKDSSMQTAAVQHPMTEDPVTQDTIKQDLSMQTAAVQQPVPQNIKLIIEYDGTRYHGWQRQKNAISVQEEIETAIYKLTGEKCVLHASGRTDVGVHALGQTAHFHTSSRIPADKVSFALNSLLPDDIVIFHSEQVEPAFHARFDAAGKKYRYLIFNSRQPSAFQKNRACHVPVTLDLEKMQAAAEILKGYHNFRAFCASGSKTKTFEREIFDIQVCKEEKLIKLEVVGSGFLYNMVRIIAATLIEIGAGKRSLEDVQKAVETGQRHFAGKTVPAQGLYLVEVYYGQRKNENT